MPRYCVNKLAQSGSGDHEVHDLSVGADKGCLPYSINQIDLGYHNSCRDAVARAKSIYSDVNGCFHCANDCHTT
jgi:hypothetical protein